MKKLIISIMVFCLTLQLLVGCYSPNYITLKELKSFNDNNDVIITTRDSTEYILRRDSTNQYYSNWEFVNDNIKWNESKVIFQKDNPKLGKYTTINTTIEGKEILKIGVEELNILNTVLLSVGILIGVVLIIGALTFELDIKPFKYQ